MSSFTSPDIDEKLALLHREMASLRVECDRLLNKHLIVEHTLTQSCSGWPNGAAETSSAYNTGGESCRSVSVTPDATFQPNSSMIQPQASPRVLRRTAKLPSPAVQRRVVERNHQQHHSSNHSQQPQVSITKPPTVVLPHDSNSNKSATSQSRTSHIQKLETNILHRTHPEHLDARRNIDEKTSVASSSSKTCRSIIRAPSAVFGALKGSSLRKLTVSKNLKAPETAASTVLSENADREKPMDPEEYAKRFRIPSYSVVLKEEKRKGSFRIPLPQYFRSVRPKPKTYVVNNFEDELEEVVDEEKMALKNDVTDATVHYKWKVKRRWDGSRYVVKRPIRNQILKKREAQLYRERAPISTDDDAMSELKLGRFHTKEERKRILEREKVKKLMKLQQKMVERAHPTEQAIYQMSQQKMARQKENLVFDDFATTREILSSRTKPDGIHGVVSVTTV